MPTPPVLPPRPPDAPRPPGPVAPWRGGIRRWAGLALAVGVLAAGWGAWWWQAQGEQGPAPPAPGAFVGQTRDAAATADGPAVRWTAPADELARLFELGYAGGLLVDAETPGRLESLLARLPSEPQDADFVELERAVREQLPREEADRAMALLASYRGYARDVREELMTSPVPSDAAGVEALLARARRLQQRHFDPAIAEALFGERNERERVALTALAIENDPQLGPAEKAQRLAQWRASLPPALQPLVPAASAGR